MHQPTLLGMARTFMIHAKLLSHLWTCTLKQVASFFNRVSHNGQTKFPYELCLKVKPSLNMVCMFGCRAYLHNIKYPKQFVLRSTPLVLVGVSDVCHGWILWDTVKKSLKQGALVIFHEDELPSNYPDSQELVAVVSSLRAYKLGDFSQIWDFCLESVLAVSSFISNAPNTCQQAL
jgi:hypothetical protein